MWRISRRRATRLPLLLILIVVGSFPLPAGAALVSHWRGDGDFSDSAGANDASAVGTVGFAPGKAGLAMHFPDAGYLEVSNPAAGGLVPAGAFTVASFIRIDGFDPPPEGGAGSVVSLATDTAPSFSLEPGGSSGLAFVARTATGGVVLRAEEVVSGAWHHVAISYDPANRTVLYYLDGARLMGLVDQPNVTEVALSPGLRFLIGRNPLGAGTFDGMIDDLRYYDEALGDAEVRALAAVPEPSAGVAALVAVGWAATRRRRLKV